MKNCERWTDVFERLRNHGRDSAVDGGNEGTLDDDQRAVIQHETEAIVELNLVDASLLGN